MALSLRHPGAGQRLEAMFLAQDGRDHCADDSRCALGADRVGQLRLELALRGLKMREHGLVRLAGEDQRRRLQRYLRSAEVVKAAREDFRKRVGCGGWRWARV